MILLQVAAAISACVTITLNAHHAYSSTTVFAYAVLFAVLNGTLDLAKCTCLVAASHAFRMRRPFSGLALVALFVPLLANSLWCGLSEVTVSRTIDKGAVVAQQEARHLAAAEHRRLSAALALMEADALYRTSAACANQSGPRARSFCQRYAATVDAQRAASGAVSMVQPTDPAPHFTVLAAVTGGSLPALQFTLALWPVLLAELVGSVGFVLGRRVDRERSNGWTGFWRRRWIAGSAARAVDPTAPAGSGRVVWRTA